MVPQGYVGCGPPPSFSDATQAIGEVRKIIGHVPNVPNSRGICLFPGKINTLLTPRDPITERQRNIRVSNHLLSKVFRFHYHSQKVIGSLGNSNYLDFFPLITSFPYHVTPPLGVLGQSVGLTLVQPEGQRFERIFQGLLGMYFQGKRLLHIWCSLRSYPP